MQISKNKVVTIDYTLKDDSGKIIDTSKGEGREALVYLHGASNLIPGLENALEGKGAGDELSVTIAPEDAYGARDQSKIFDIPKARFGDQEIQVGARYNASGPEGDTVVLSVVEVKEDSVMVDANHPLAGMQLSFDVKVMDIRDATEEEISHGHAHGPGDQHHD